MSRLRIMPIVEGHGEFNCIRILLERIRRELLAGEFVNVLRPIRGTSGQLVKQKGIQHAVRLAGKALKQLPATGDPTLVLILIDADEACPRNLGPELLRYAREENSAIDIACVLAKCRIRNMVRRGGRIALRVSRSGVPPAGTGIPRGGEAWKGMDRGAISRSRTQIQPDPRSTRDDQSHGLDPLSKTGPFFRQALP